MSTDFRLDLSEHDEATVHKYAGTLADRNSPLLAEVLGYDPRDADPLTVTEVPAAWRPREAPAHLPHELVLMAWLLCLVALIAVAGFSRW